MQYISFETHPRPLLIEGRIGKSPLTRGDLEVCLIRVSKTKLLQNLSKKRKDGELNGSNVCNRNLKGKPDIKKEVCWYFSRYVTTDPKTYACHTFEVREKIPD